MRPLSELPNTEGFRFVGIRHDGSRVACCRRPDYVVSWRFITVDAVGNEQPDLAGWEPTNRHIEDAVDARMRGTLGV